MFLVVLDANIICIPRGAIETPFAPDVLDAALSPAVSVGKSLRGVTYCKAAVLSIA